MATQKNDAPGAGLVLGAAVLWGSVGPAQVLAASPLGPAALGGWRLLLGGAVLWLFAVRNRSALRGLADRTVLRPLLVCAFSTGLYQAAFLASVSRTGAALGTVIALGTAPVATGIFARIATGERIGAAWVLSTAAAVAGCALLLAPGSTVADPLGLLLGLIAGTCYGVYTVFAKQLAANNPHVHPPTVASVSLIIGAVPLTPWMILDNEGLFGDRTLGLIAWLALATTAAAYWLFSIGLARASTTTVGTLSLAEPWPRRSSACCCSANTCHRRRLRAAP
ncbi:DMT family transporter [Amycolatopsis anabasis]|uniref:DMT family transporter n=1 Tax=Amycolatopsis anabasis TaxID=1840409 RepID=UPI00131BCBF4|nr:DMT family transporter [Amycolatopsis anabasis]